jgi:hypothetical protein
MRGIILALALSLLSASAQYRYPVVTLTTASNTVAANGSSTINSAADVGATTRADILFYFSLTTNNVAGLTNPVVAQFDTSIDGSKYTNAFSISLRANSNNVVWMQTNVWVTNASWLRFVGITTNENALPVTNYVVKVGQKTGL